MRENHPTDEKYNLPIQQRMFSEQEPLLSNTNPMKMKSPQPNRQFFMSFNPDHLKHKMSINQPINSIASTSLLKPPVSHSLAQSSFHKYPTIEKKQPLPAT